MSPAGSGPPAEPTRKILSRDLASSRPALPRPPSRRYPPLLPPEGVPWPYVLDAGPALGFASVGGGLDLLAEHYQDRIYVADVVLNELSGLASRTPPGRVRAPKPVRDAARKIILGDGGRFLRNSMLRLTQDEAAQTDDLLVEIQGLGAGRDEARPLRHRGECTSIVAAKRLGPREVVLLSNDEHAIRLAGNHGIAGRTVVDILNEMIYAERIFDDQKMNADLAWHLFERMAPISNVSDRRKPSGPESFAVLD